MTYEVSAAAKSPQTTPLCIGIRVDRRGGNGEYHRRRASGRCAHLDRQNGTNDSRNGEAAQRRGGGDTRRSPPRIDANAYKKGGCLRQFCRRRHFVRHCSRVIGADSPLKTAYYFLLATRLIGAQRAES